MKNEQIRSAGLKVTLPRVKILTLLERHENNHLSAEDVYKLLLDDKEEIGLATVYRVLTQFEEAGLVKRQHFESGLSTFELDSGLHHDHILCLDCGHVEEFMDEVIEKRQHQVAKSMGFELERHVLTLYGTCKQADCPRRSKK